MDGPEKWAKFLPHGLATPRNEIEAVVRIELQNS